MRIVSKRKNRILLSSLPSVASIIVVVYTKFTILEMGGPSYVCTIRSEPSPGNIAQRDTIKIYTTALQRSLD